MKVSPRSGTVVLASALLVLGCASAAMSQADAIVARQQLMKDQGAAARTIGEKIKAGQHQAIGPEAEKLVSTAKQIPGLFPKDSLDPATSRAKPEIWQKWSEFEGNAKNLEEKATQLAALARTGTAEQVATAVTDLGRTTCTTCHNTFRGPEIKK
jgi:cytochrome c556